ncbi:hypothetical protein KDA06_04235 [Candidatus Saccharibacteria bacterium]|nr:hypothetical protein [Candidatus Saccharibacteria bacterium]
MALTKQKPITRTPVHRKRTGQHHRKGAKYTRPYWPYLPMVVIITLGIIANSLLGSLRTGVLGYATNTTIGGLLASTNSERASNGYSSLQLNTQLNAAATAKARDMAINDYWAHVSPTGITPWYWFSNAGYSYATAGENLAYGFTTSGETITGWMNSPGHRANILNANFQEVGFGIYNAENYQGSGPQTIVVAMYAQPAVPVATTPAPTPAPAPSPTPVPVSVSTTPKVAPTPVQQTPPAVPAAPTEPQPAAAPAEPTALPAPRTDTAIATQNKAEQVPGEVSLKVSRAETLRTTNVAWNSFAISMITVVALLVFLLRHSLAWHRFLRRGEKFVIHHPLVDIGVVSLVVVGFLLMQTTGLIK